ncbi:MAG TPA: Ig-like domain-containing protein [Microlunatus sp.]|nr:Ig-like domain-containing protein [Microlunatus sp.]
MTLRDRRLISAAALLAAVTLAAAGCGTIPEAGGATAPGSSTRSTPPTGSSQQPQESAPEVTASSTPTPDPVRFTPNVKNGAKNVKVSTVVAVKAANGTVGSVELSYKGVDAKGRAIKGEVDGALAGNKTGWTAGTRLEPGSTYTLTVSGRNPQGEARTTRSTFKTQALSLQQQTFAQLQPLEGSNVGVGMPVILTFDVAVKNRREFEKHLTVTSSPKQPGTWSWFSDKEVHFRPQHYWKPGTKVSVSADLNSLDAGNGVYGQNSTSTSFTIGRSLVTKINLDTHKAKVYIAGDLKRTIPISGGKSGWQTRSGTKLIMEKLPVTRMTNEMIGADESYDLRVKYALRVTWSGEFLHAAPWNAAYLGRANASHGCVGMSTSDAAWLFNRVQIGDPVITTGSGRGLEQGNGYTDWDVSWSQYQKGSAL